MERMATRTLLNITMIRASSLSLLLVSTVSSTYCEPWGQTLCCVLCFSPTL